MQAAPSVDCPTWPMEATNIVADQLRRAVEELLHAPSVSPARLQNVARQIILDSSAAEQSIRRLLREPQMMLPNADQGRNSFINRYVFGSGLQTARLLVWSADRLRVPENRLELYTIAALLQNIGLLLAKPIDDSVLEWDAIQNDSSYRQHPPVGAALAAGLCEYSVDLPFLIAQHHERLDGTGFPNGLRSRKLLTGSKLLAVIGRFVELMDRDSTATAAARLAREAEQGELDGDFTTHFLGALEPLMNYDAAGPIPSGDNAPAGFSDFASKGWRWDIAHGGGQPPHQMTTAGKPLAIDN